MSRRKTKTELYGKQSISDQYELNRENTLVSQAGLITAVFSFSTTALFTVWEIGIAELDRIPDWLVHVVIGIVTSPLLLSMLFSVLALFQIINTEKKPISIKYIKVKNNRMVKLIKISIIFFILALLLVFVSAICLGIIYYLLPLSQMKMKVKLF